MDERMAVALFGRGMESPAGLGLYWHETAFDYTALDVAGQTILAGAKGLARTLNGLTRLTRPPSRGWRRHIRREKTAHRRAM